MHLNRKILVIMRMIFVLTTATCLQVSAVGYSQTVTLTVREQSLETVFQEIKAQTGYVFWYKLDILRHARKVTADVRDQELRAVLDTVFNNQPLTYAIVGKTIAVKLKETVDAPPITISGKVTDEKGLPVAGVTVQVKGMPGGVTTDATGEFRMPGVREDAVLLFSSVGYQAQEIRVGGRTSLSVTLHNESQSLGDMVVVGYGSASRRSLSSAITTIKPDELNRGAITDVGQLLQGKSPGLNITASGDPNKPAAVILRGVTTINSPTGPFYVIDGVPGADISTVAPDDIASVDVLKDAAATAIYGNRAANGLIMITTRRGKKGQVLVTYNGYVGTEQVSNRVQVMNAPELRSFVTKNGLGFSSNDDKGANTDWQKAIERSTAVSTNHNISFSGGGEHNTYSATVNYAKKEGIIRNTDLSRVIGRLNIDQYVLNDRLKFSLNVVNSYSNGDEVPYLGVILLQAAHYLPISPVKNPDGSYFEDKATGGYYNPVAMENHSTMNDKNNNLIGSLNTQLRLPWGLSYDINLSYQNYSNLHGEYYDSYYTTNYNNMYNNPDPGPTGRTQQSFGSNGQAYRSSYTSNSKLLETFFTWDRKFGDHSVKAVLGYSWQDNVNNDGFQATTFNFPVDNISYNNFALSAPYANPNLPKISFGADGLYQETKLIADFMRVNYSYQDKYLFQGSVRRDGSSVFGANHQFGYFPSFSAGWRISQEGFMRDQRLFNELKLRGSYGIVGNAFGFNAYTAQAFSGLLGTFYSNGSQLNAYGPTQAANPNLKWEQTAIEDIGIDFAVLGSRITGSVDVYNKNTTGMIFPYLVNQFLIPTGTIVANGGGMNNKGIELMVTATPVSRADLSWTTTVNLSHNINKITSLNNPLFAGVDSIPEADPEGGGESGVKLQVLKGGRPLGQYFTLKYAGKAPDGTTLFINHNGKPDSNYVIGTDYHYLGNAQPKLIYGWSNTFRYKSWSLNVFFRGVLGDQLFNATRADLFRPATAGTVNILKDAVNEKPSDPNVFRYSSRFIESGSYLRLDNATLAYTFKSIGSYIRNIRAYATVNNVFTITGYKGIDPEINQGGVAPGVDYNNFYPKTRTVLVGVNVSF